MFLEKRLQACNEMTTGSTKGFLKNGTSYIVQKKENRNFSVMIFHKGILKRTESSLTFDQLKKIVLS